MGMLPWRGGPGAWSSPSPVQSRTRNIAFFNCADLCVAPARRAAPVRRSFHQKPNDRTNGGIFAWIASTLLTQLEKVSVSYCAAKRSRPDAKSALAPVKLATRDFSEAARLRLTGTR